jgi:hypothetical protein
MMAAPVDAKGDGHADRGAGNRRHGLSHGASAVRGGPPRPRVEPQPRQGGPAGAIRCDGARERGRRGARGGLRRLHAGERPGDRRGAVPARRGAGTAPRHALHRHGLHPAPRGTRPRGAAGRAQRAAARCARLGRHGRRRERHARDHGGRQGGGLRARGAPVPGARARHARGPERRRRTGQARQPDDRRHHDRRGGRSAAHVPEGWRGHGQGARGHRWRLRRKPHPAGARPAHGGARLRAARQDRDPAEGHAQRAGHRGGDRLRSAGHRLVRAPVCDAGEHGLGDLDHSGLFVELAARNGLR